MASVVFPRDEVTLPGEQGVGGDQCLYLTKRTTTEGLGLRGQAPPLGVGEAEPAGAELFAQHPCANSLQRPRVAAHDSRGMPESGIRGVRQSVNYGTCSHAEMSRFHRRLTYADNSPSDSLPGDSR